MGYWTEFHFATILKNDTPDAVFALLNYMSIPFEEKYRYCAPVGIVPNHKLFTNDTRWRWMLSAESPFIFDHRAHFRAEKKREGQNTKHLEFTINLKSYDGEIILFLDWIQQYIDLGYHGGQSHNPHHLGHIKDERNNYPRLIMANWKVKNDEGYPEIFFVETEPYDIKYDLSDSDRVFFLKDEYARGGY